jgi:hypothetical protein
MRSRQCHKDILTCFPYCILAVLFLTFFRMYVYMYICIYIVIYLDMSSDVSSDTFSDMSSDISEIQADTKIQDHLWVYLKTWSYPREHASHRPLLSRLYEDEQTPGPLKKCRVATGYRGTGTFQAEFAVRNFGNTWVEEIPLVRDFPEREIRLPRT